MGGVGAEAALGCIRVAGAVAWGCTMLPPERFGERRLIRRRKMMISTMIAAITMRAAEAMKLIWVADSLRSTSKLPLLSPGAAAAIWMGTAELRTKV